MQQKFSVSYSALGEVGSTVSFLKRRLVMMDDGIMLVPGTAASKVVECFESTLDMPGFKRFQQMLPCNRKTTLSFSAQKIQRSSEV